MILCDTHSHIYLSDFDSDRKQVVERAVDKGVKYLLLPNIDSHSIKSLLDLCDEYPQNCFPMTGLHPTDVKANYRDELKTVEEWLDKRKFYAVGEIGIDLYWDKTFSKEQEEAFLHQAELAVKYNLPVVIHSRNSTDILLDIIEKINNPDLTGVFHCFSGNVKQAEQAIKLGFKLGIGGVVTYKNSGLAEVVKQTDIKHILLETDAPYLTPAPHRGKRNEPSYLHYIAEKIAEIKQMTKEEVAEATTANAKELFRV